MTGVLVEPANVDALTEALALLLDDEGRRAVIGANAAVAAERHGVDEMVQRFEALWAELLGLDLRPTGSPR